MTIKAKNRTPEQWRSRANILVWKAVSSGKLPRLSENHIKCTDCDERATDYDHRDYRKPLKVEPTCRKCNLNRGIGKPFLTGSDGKWGNRASKPNGIRWDLDEGDGDTCYWFNGHALIEPDEKLLEQHENYLYEFRWDNKVNPYWNSELAAATDEIIKMSRRKHGSTRGNRGSP